MTPPKPCLQQWHWADGLFWPARFPFTRSGGFEELGWYQKRFFDMRWRRGVSRSLLLPIFIHVFHDSSASPSEHSFSTRPKQQACRRIWQGASLRISICWLCTSFCPSLSCSSFAESLNSRILHIDQQIPQVPVAPVSACASSKRVEVIRIRSGKLRADAGHLAVKPMVKHDAWYAEGQTRVTAHAASAAAIPFSRPGSAVGAWPHREQCTTRWYSQYRCGIITRVRESP